MHTMPANFPQISLVLNKPPPVLHWADHIQRAKQKAGGGGQQGLFLKNIWESFIKSGEGVVHKT